MDHHAWIEAAERAEAEREDADMRAVVEERRRDAERRRHVAAEENGAAEQSAAQSSAEERSTEANLDARRRCTEDVVFGHS